MRTEIQCEKLVELIRRVAHEIVREPDTLELETETSQMSVRLALKPGRPGDVPVLIGKAGRTFKALQMLTRILGDRMGIRATLANVIDHKITHQPVDEVPLSDPKEWAEDPRLGKLITDIIEATGTTYEELDELESDIKGASYCKTYQLKGVRTPRGVSRDEQQMFYAAVRNAMEVVGRINGADIMIEFVEAASEPHYNR